MIEIRSVSGYVLYTAKTATDVRSAVIEANLYGADLYRADLYRANLSGANLRGAKLSGAKLSGANLYGADLYEANLYRANLRGAKLSGAKLSGANLSGAKLSEANLYGADLRGADLYEANLSGANLYRANLRGAKLSGAKLSGAKDLSPLAAAEISVPPEEGSIIGWKKASAGRIVKLKIPAKAKRSNATGRKCRASEAKVLAIFERDGSVASEAFSTHDPTFQYVVGEVVRPTQPFDEDRWNECASGIHFFITRIEAENY